MSSGIRGLLLCGGLATRFGGDKLLFEIDHAGARAPMASFSAASLVAGAGNALAVIPPGAAALARVLERAGCDILETPRTARGLGASLAAGVAHARDARGWIVALGDMPFVSAATVAAVRAALEGGAGAAAPVSRESGERGHPVGFSALLASELLALDGDAGARAVIARHQDRFVAVPVDDPGIHIDIDTRADLPRAGS